MPKNPLWEKLRGRGPHPGYLAGLVTDQPVLVRQRDLVAYISHIGAYPEGFTFTAFVEQATEDGPLSGNEPHVEVNFADGRTWRYDLDMRGDFMFRPEAESSGGPGGQSWRARYWLPALPPEGPLTFCRVRTPG